jgi:hypothetical protein
MFVCRAGWSRGSEELCALGREAKASAAGAVGSAGDPAAKGSAEPHSEAGGGPTTVMSYEL